MKTCHICQSTDIVELLDLGEQPISNRFLPNPEAEETSYPIVVNQCNACGTVQINDPVPAEEVKPRYDWITYREPDAHLNSLADTLSQLSGLSKDAAIAGISYKDDPLLERMEQRGFSNIWRLDPQQDLGIDDPSAGIEILQERLTPQTAQSIVATRGKVDLLIVRHILEHAHHLHSFVAGLRELLTPQGYIVFEVPDCERSLSLCDYTTIWEEHLVYFTPETFRNCFGFCGFSLVHFESFPYPFENSLVGIGQAQESAIETFPTLEKLEAENQRGTVFSQGLEKRRDRLKEFFSNYQQEQGKIALMGAGHLCCAFVTFLELDDYFEFVVDDNPNKQNLFMPGSRLPIYSSATLLEKEIKLCLLSLSPDSETKVVQKNQAFLEQGGTFASIFPASQLALKI
ncbi:methyltransferase domain-containing protein [Lusitaniella coriacea LEGE 07157]|uniref:Methyltransferase domain-containing protein n=1 Tax=Lusitaniella coriacea LEGE 07157 TaxID=945747 RepID=A0A8J7DXB4_9CYAN|nr:class I SAM-dependent methyltransferase [Lusitaniella coriacea]MBE9116858.1 methyltransferase domain-containing protein [Lusitaniella coriacea LEGE 07157]